MLLIFTYHLCVENFTEEQKSNFDLELLATDADRRRKQVEEREERLAFANRFTS